MLAKRGKKQYFYKSFRENGKECKKYIGDEKSKAAQDYIKETEQKKIEQEERRQRKKELELLNNTMDQVSSLTDRMIRLFLIENEYFKRKSEIRRLKYAD